MQALTLIAAAYVLLGHAARITWMIRRLVLAIVVALLAYMLTHAAVG